MNSNGEARGNILATLWMLQCASLHLWKYREVLENCEENSTSYWLVTSSDQHSMKSGLLLSRKTPTRFMLNKSGYTLAEWTAWLGLFFVVVTFDKRLLIVDDSRTAKFVIHVSITEISSEGNLCLEGCVIWSCSVIIWMKVGQMVVGGPNIETDVSTTLAEVTIEWLLQ